MKQPCMLLTGLMVSSYHAMPGITSEKQTRRIRWRVVATCLVLLIVMGSAAVAFAVEARIQYAVAFFEENGLSTRQSEPFGGESRLPGHHYRRFTYEKTVDVLTNHPRWRFNKINPRLRSWLYCGIKTSG